MGVFDGIRVIELGSDGALSYCGKLFADFGAEVVKAEVPGGDPLRQMEPRIDIGGTRESAWFGWANTNKRSITADWRDAADAERLSALIAASDVLLDARAPRDVLSGRLAHDTLRADHPGLILTHVTAFGTGGPYADHQASPAVLRALGGLVEGMGPVDGPPMIVDDTQTAVTCGLAAFIPTAAALFDRAAGGRGIELSCQEALAHAVELDMSYATRGVPRRRSGVNLFGRHYPSSIYRTADGWLGVSTVTPAQWRGMCEAFGLGDIADHPNYATHDARLANAAELDATLEPAIAQKTSEAWFRLCNARKLPVVIVPRMDQLLEQKVHRERGAFVPVRFGDARYEGPVLPARLGGAEEPLAGGTAPRAGAQDGDYIDLPAPRPAGQRAPGDRRPLAGVRIIDLSMGWAGPFATRHLADLGAEVIKVEGCSYPDWWRGTHMDRAFYEDRLYEKNNAYLMMNRNKRGITLDLTVPEGRQLLLDLVAGADGFIENYSSEVLPKLGLSHDVLQAANPKLVILPMAAFGLGNDWSATRAYGGTLEQAAGLPTLVGAPDWPPAMAAYAYGDPIGGYNAAAAMILGLLARQRTGAGRIIRFSQIEGMLTLAAAGITEQSATGQLAERTGNRHRSFAPQGAYRCGGTDDWLVLTVRSDGDWTRLAPVIGLDDPALTKVEARRAQHDRIDAAISDWCAGRTADKAMAALQAQGLAAGVARSTPALLTDPNLVARDTWARLPRAFVSESVLQRTAYRFEGQPCPITNPSPTLGEHNTEVFTRILGLSPADLRGLEARGIIGTEAVPKGGKVPA
ncbi:CaiB/BaiF CoA transferase family protein [Pseudooceanicola sp. LIPI14-2-Ac024]|uniref:CaiB/BaiF CoA transferase family protein n=1 Tax=Pseudooceanicola sp. LIPI14-2-Ac024 TaxID=3344875 RepID=UPI0035D1098A